MRFRKEKDKFAEIEISSFSNKETEESHLIVKPTIINTPFEEQLGKILSSFDAFLEKESINSQSVVLLRFFVSDYANQSILWEILDSYKNKKYSKCAISVVQQPPLNGGKVAIWAYLVKDKEGSLSIKSTKLSEKELMLQRPNYQHLWSTHLTTSNGATESLKQTENIFKAYNQRLSEQNMLLKENCIRTWLFVRDVDFNYQGVVEARKNFFETLGMTKETHFITSTGIEGRHYDAKNSVLMDAYAVKGISDKQVKFLTAPTKLNPTHEYGVTFERGTSVDYGDRRHIFISGTASINNKGEVVHKKEVAKQINRTFENIKALLEDADANFQDIAQMIIYLRDIADRDKVNEYFKEHYQEIPKIIVLAPVCRPEWLIEIECIAIKTITKKEFAIF